MQTPVKERKSVYEIPLDEAITLTKAWADQGKFYKAFLLDAREMQDILNELGSRYVRVYFGWDVNQEEGRHERLIMVPANDEGNDMLPNKHSVTHHQLTEANSNVFDFTLPCPPTCDVNSPLFQTFQPSK